jgi:hypothetical protein
MLFCFSSSNLLKHFNAFLLFLFSPPVQPYGAINGTINGAINGGGMNGNGLLGKRNKMSTHQSKFLSKPKILKIEMTMVEKAGTERFFVALPLLMNRFSNKLVMSGKSFKR